jgi:hypothetical protein
VTFYNPNLSLFVPVSLKFEFSEAGAVKKPQVRV